MRTHKIALYCTVLYTHKLLQRTNNFPSESKVNRQQTANSPLPTLPGGLHLLFYSPGPPTPNCYEENYIMQENKSGVCTARHLPLCVWANQTWGARSRAGRKKEKNSHDRPMHGKHIMSHRRTYDAVHKRIPLPPPLAILHVRGSV